MNRTEQKVDREGHLKEHSTDGKVDGCSLFELAESCKSDLMHLLLLFCD